jgi:hypothetical protein
MKLVSKYDVEAPAAFVFAQLADFDAWERAAMRRGADVTRSDTLRTPGPGMTWACKFRYAGKDRKVALTLDRISPISAISLSMTAAPVDGDMQIDILDLAAKRARIEVRLEVKPKTLAARLYVQSLRLARSRVERGFAKRVAQLAVEIEDRFKRSGRP